MAITAANRVKVRRYLGWSARFSQTDGALERAITALETEPESETELLALVVECERIDTAITDAESRLKASKVGSIELNDGEVATLRSRGRQVAGRLAALLGVEIRSDAFSGNPSSQRAGWYGPSGGGNYQLHG